MGLVDRLLETPWVYRAWQAPFADRKLAPLFRHADPSGARRVLDVGCGPGTNARHFETGEYLGIDLNPEYIATARQAFSGTFQVGDVTRLELPERHFDFILANSLFHHIDDAGTERGLELLAASLEPGGTIHIFDLVLPPHRGPARALARLDRGDFARPLAAWKSIFSRHFEPLVFEPYGLGTAGITLWSMIYFQGRRREAGQANPRN